MNVTGGCKNIAGQIDRIDEIVQAAADQYATAFRLVAKVAVELSSSGNKLPRGN